MEKQIYLTKKILLAAGIVEIAAGLLHFIMPSSVYQSAGFSLLQPNEINFVTLLIHAVGILLSAFGTLTILFSVKLESMIEPIYYYVIVKAIFWSGRVVLEVVYPVNLNMFNVDPFTLFVLPAVSVETALFIVSAILMRKIVVAKGV